MKKENNQKNEGKGKQEKLKNKNRPILTKAKI